MSAPTVKLPKRLILLCDGTWQNSDTGWEKDSIQMLGFGKGHPQIPTNVTRIARAILPESKTQHPQIVYYQAGVGSDDWSIEDHLLGGGLAYGLSENVREAYGFLVHNYIKVGDVADEIFLVGFSRGAFTARSVGGMISSIGLLEKSAMQYFYYIFEDFENAGKSGYKPQMPGQFSGFELKVTDNNDTYFEAYKQELIKHGLTRDVHIKAIGVWDTVGELGLPVVPWLQKIGLPTTLHSYRFFDTGISNRVENAFQALALDERRAAFQAAVWEKKANNNTTKLKQVWFPGVHSSIGGGYADTTVSDITLAWMMSNLAPYIDFNEQYLLDQVKANIAAIYPPPATATNSPAAKWQWGNGTIYESLKFPTSLAGSTTRSPDRYHRVDYDSGKPLPDMLRDTYEAVHPCVRARSEFGGLNAAGKPYGVPGALAGWVLKQEETKRADDDSGAAVAKDEVRHWWEYGGPDKNAAGRTMEEEKLGYFEKLLLDLDPGTKGKLYPHAVGLEA